MTEELKTLKDLEYLGFPIFKEDSIALKVLKEEAIKWTKFLDSDSYDACRWIKHFFNINEEDLK